MQLLDLAPELLDAVFTNVVQIQGVRGAFKIRPVCSESRPLTQREVGANTYYRDIRRPASTCRLPAAIL